MLQKAPLLLCLGLSVSAVAQADCSPTSLERINQMTQGALLQLQGIREEEEADDAGVISAAAGGYIRAFKDALVNGIDRHMSCSAADSDNISLQQALLPLITPLPAVRQAQMLYGDEPDLVVTRQPEFPDIVLIRGGFGIPCGDDNVLLAYQLRDGKWARVLRWQSDDYREISGAFGDSYLYQLLPPAREAAPPSIIVAHGTPWCTSRWSIFNADLIELATKGAEQRTLFHLQNGYIRITDDDAPPLRLKANPQGFELRMEVGMLDTALMTRRGIYRYRIDGERLERVQPAAMNGRDFVDEWLQVDEATAARWSAPIPAGALIEAHQSLKNRYGAYGAVRQCRGDRERYQVEMQLSERDTSGAEPTAPAQDTFFIIRPIVDGFMMESVSTRADPECTGHDIMAERRP